MRFAALEERADEDREIGDPDDGEPQVDVPFGLGIFTRLGDAQYVAGGGEHDEELVAPEHEAGETRQRKAGAAGALHDVEARRDERVAAEREDYRRRVQRPQPAERGVFKAQIEDREGQLERDEETGEEADHAPEHRRDHAPADGIVVVSAGIDRRLEDAARDGVVRARERRRKRQQRSHRDDRHVDRKSLIGRKRDCDDRDERCAQPAEGLDCK